MAANEARLEEIETLKSIYFPDELQVRETNNPGELLILAWAPIELPDGYQVKYLGSPPDLEPTCIKVKHLPPVHLKIVLPETYPESAKPRMTLRCEWLTDIQRSRLSRALFRKWQQNKWSPIIYQWVEFVKSDTLTLLEIEWELDISAVCNQHKGESTCGPNGKASGDMVTKEKKTVQNSVVQIIEAYDKEQRKADFMKQYHLCEICFSEKSGKESMMFERCGHTYCRHCLSGYFTVLINEGNAKSVRCPGFKCVAEISQSQLRELVSAETFEKYDNALLSAILDTLGDIVYCPRRICQYPVTWEPEERVAVCPMCRFAFCVFCKMVYHGVEPCRFTSDERRRLVDEYENGTADEKLHLEKRYGKKQMTDLVHNSLNEGWINENSKNCPQCKSSIEKSEGCNKMTCWRCQTCFCWLCSTILSPIEPYLHFRDPKSPCNEKLFFLGAGMEDDGWGDWEIFQQEDSGESDLEGEDPDSEG